MKLLHIGMYNEIEGQESMRAALESISTEYTEYSFTQHRMDALLQLKITGHSYDVVFLHIQSPGVISVPVIRDLYQRGVKVFNFTGDVRQPIPAWYLELAPYVTTLFTNLHDVEVFHSKGFRAEYFQVGYNSHYYNRFVVADPHAPAIVFIGNNYGNTFPLGQLRKEMVDRLRIKYGKRFSVYGTGWGKSENLNADQVREAKIYRGCKIAINLSHFNLKRYSSDRLFRILGCEAFCLSHRYKEIEKEFEDGKELVTWATLDELESLIDKFLYLHDDRKFIAMQGNIKCETTYTWDVRMQQLIQIIRDWKIAA